MKIIVTHYSPDLDAIAAIWLLRKFLPGWNQAKVKFVPAGERLEEKGKGKREKGNALNPKPFTLYPVVEFINNCEVIHVDTGLGALDHHQIPDENVSAASLTWEFILKEAAKNEQKITREHQEAISRIIKVVTEIDHFKEALWENPIADYHEFSLLGIFEGLKKEFPKKEKFQIDFLIKCFEALLHRFEDRVWAEKELKKGIKFRTKYGLGIAFKTINDTVLPLAQKMGFSLVVRKDPRKGYVRIKARPKAAGQKEIDLTPAYKKLKKLDREASWFLHVSKKMLLNGTTKSSKMKPTKLTLKEIIAILKAI